jgi:parvulin-like peptidyl-prolyl isomerase
MRFEYVRTGFFLLVFFFFLSACPTISEGAGDPVAKVNGSVLTEIDLQDEINRVVPAIGFHGGISPERMAKYRPKAIESMIESELLYQEALEIGLRADKKEIKNAIKTLRKKMGGKKKFRAALKVKGLTEKEYKKMLEKMLLVNMIVNQEIERKSVVTEEAAREYYETNRESYVRPAARRLSHILISVAPNSLPEERQQKMQRAEDIREKAVGGEDFGLLAWDYSDDPYKYKSGDLGLVHKGRLDPSLEEEVERLKVGEISEVIHTIYGFHIIKVNEIMESAQLEFREVSQKIMRELAEKKRESLREELISRLKEKADIEVYK